MYLELIGGEVYLGLGGGAHWYKNVTEVSNSLDELIEKALNYIHTYTCN